MEIMIAQQMQSECFNASPQPVERPSQGSPNEGFEGAMNRALGDDDRSKKTAGSDAVSSMRSGEKDPCAQCEQAVKGISVNAGKDSLFLAPGEQGPALVADLGAGLEEEPDECGPEPVMNPVMTFAQYETTIPRNKSLDCSNELMSVSGGGALQHPQKYETAIPGERLMAPQTADKAELKLENVPYQLADGFGSPADAPSLENVVPSPDLSALRDNVLKISQTSAPAALATGIEALKQETMTAPSGEKPGAVNLHDLFTSNAETEGAESLSLTDEGQSSGMGIDVDAFKQADTGSFEAGSFEHGSGGQSEEQRNISRADAGIFAALDPGTPAPSSNVSLKSAEPHSLTHHQQLADGVFERFSSGVRLGAGSGLKEVSLALHPEELGSVTIRLKVENSAVTAHIIVDSQSVKGIFDSDTGRLRDIFAQNGLSLESCSVDVGSGQGFRNDASAGEGQGWSAAPARQARGAYREGLEPDASIPAAGRTMRQWADGSVDLFI